MTYNILTGGLDESDDSRWNPLLNVIGGTAPDILILNECNHFELGRNRNLHRMERATGMRALFAPATTGFHVAILVSREIEVIEHQATSTVHHAMLEAKLGWRGHELSVVGVHLCPFGGQNRLAEAELLTRCARQEEWVFVAGDMNSISPHDVERCELHRWAPRRQARHLISGTEAIDTRAMALLERAGLVDLAKQAGINATPTALTSLRNDHETYRVRIDYVFGSPRAARHLRHAEVIRSEAAERASDHYPLFVDIELE